MELDWNSPIVSRAWTDGFHSADQNRYQYYDFGDCASCPSIYHPSWSPNNGWTLADIWYVAWGAGPAFPLPLIYANDGINAYQWQYLSRYSSVNKGGAILFPGPMTESQACVQQNGCGSLNNTPQQGWTQLFEALNSEPRTAQKYLPWETDIKYYYK
jgi:hypothetical protein